MSGITERRCKQKVTASLVTYSIQHSWSVIIKTVGTVGNCDLVDQSGSQKHVEYFILPLLPERRE